MEPTLTPPVLALFGLAAATAPLAATRLLRLVPLVRETTLAPTLVWAAIVQLCVLMESASVLVGLPMVVHHSLAILTAVLFTCPTLFLLLARRGRTLGAHGLTLLYVFIVSNTLWIQLGKGYFVVEGRPGLHQVRFLYLALFTLAVFGNHVASTLRIPVGIASLGAALHLFSVGPWQLEAEPWLRSVGLVLMAAAPLWPLKLGRPSDRYHCVSRLFLDLWGLAWWESVKERFNDAAKRRRWKVAITSRGLVDAEDLEPVACNAVAPEVFDELVRQMERFAPREFFEKACGLAARDAR